MRGADDRRLEPAPSRRRFLGALALPVASGSVPPVIRSGSLGSSTHDGDAFDPGVHGFGFRNWSTTVPTYPEHDHDAVTEEQVRRTLSDGWGDPLARVLDLAGGNPASSVLDAIAKQLYVTVNQWSATNGHCYGMVFSAQEYFESPESIPLGRPSASEFTNPADPLDVPGEAPVGQEIDLFQNTQFLDFYAWLGRRGVLRPGWIDHATQLDHVRDAIDTFGTAGVTLVNKETRTSHQVLLYGYESGSTAMRFDVYDPNRAATEYGTAANRPTLRVDTSGPEPVLEPYSSLEYDAFVYNRYDRIIAMRGNRAPASPVDLSTDELRDGLFPVVVLLADADVNLTVVGPRGRSVGRTVSPFMDRRRTEYQRIRVRYGGPAGRYRAVVASTAPTDYSLSVIASGLEGELLDAERPATIEPGDVHEYDVLVPESPGEGGAIERLDDGVSRATAGGVAVGAAGLATGAYALVRRRR